MYQFSYSFLKKMLGTTLIELMIALVLGVMMVGFLLELYMQSQKSNQLLATVNIIQNNAKTALDLLSSDISKAGYIGCSYLDESFQVYSQEDFSLSKKSKIDIKNANEIVVRYAGHPSVLLSRPIEGNRIIHTTSEVKFSPGEVMIISDCKQAEIFIIENSYMIEGKQKMTASRPLQLHFSSYAEISRLEINKYFVEKTNRKDKKGSIIYALYRQDIKGRKLELVEGVSEMKIEKEERPGTTGVSMVLRISINAMQRDWYAYVAV